MADEQPVEQPADIADIIARATPRERTVRICIRGDLAGRAEELQDQITQVSEDWEPEDLTDVHPARALAQEMKELREQVKASEVPFTLRYIGEKKYSDLVAAHPSDDKNEAWGETFPAALIAASCVSPRMTEDQAHQLFEKVNQGEVKKLFDAAWDVHNASDIVPFSLAVSALLAGLGGEK
ncbi:hypothetical protein OOK29_26100 [Streptomyces phaeochromogenes]|uniref:hypothetical protein n=1 Tax=Streptomyces phaeochromogenes TaxID=1923 RepID=UPI00225547A4|nr:hypothetical protein [Streptomyces phaeochromogenes]MCX5601628.1 hypothetical protein [Streptomyces phaeochromogenes]